MGDTKQQTPRTVKRETIVAMRTLDLLTKKNPELREPLLHALENAWQEGWHACMVGIQEAVGTLTITGENPWMDIDED